MAKAQVHRLHPVAKEPWGGYYPSEILERPKPRRWLVDSMIPYREVVLLAGSPKSSKSYLLQQLVTSAALEVPWIGQYVERVKCLGLFLEDDADELNTRQIHICEAYGRDVSLLDTNLEFNPREWLSTKLVEFPKGSEDPKWTPLGEWLWDVVGENGYQLIVIDTATRALGWPARWSGDKASNVATALRRKANEHNAAIIVTDHTSRADSSSFAGTNTWWGSVRAAMNLRVPIDEVTREPERGVRLLRDLGGNYGSFDPIRMVWRNNVLEAEQPEAIAQRPRSAAERAEFGYELLAYLGKCVQHGKLVPIDETDRQSLPSRVRRWRKIPLNDLYTAQQWMLDQKLVDAVKVQGKCCIRPHDCRYPEEQPWP